MKNQYLRGLFSAWLLLIGLVLQAAVSVTVAMSDHQRLVAANAKKTLAEVYTVAEAKAEYPDAFRAMATTRQWTDAQTMQLAMFNAFFTDAVWRGALYQSVTGSVQGRIISRNHIVCDVQGAWWFNDNLYYAYGTYVFPNGGPGNAEYNSDLGGFELVHWYDRWVGPNSNRPNGDRVLFGAFHGGSDQLVDYSEGTWFNGALRIDGRGGDWANPARATIIGFEWWDSGEVSNTFGAFIHHCDIGFRAARGTPTNAPFAISCFSNTIAGFEFMGVANFGAAMLSGDDNPAFVRSVSGYGRPATFNGNTDNIKMEWAVTPASMRLWKPARIELSGQFKWEVGTLTYAATNARTATLFWLNPTINDSYLKVNVMDAFDKKVPDYIAMDVKNGKAWKWNPWAVGFEYFSYPVAKLTCWPVPCEEVPIPYYARTGYVPPGGQIGADGSPFWSDVTGNGGAVSPPPSQCVYTYSAWGPCVNGQQSRTVLSSSPVGCTGVPVTTQPCSEQSIVTFSTTFSGSGPNLVALTGSTIQPTTGSTATFSSGTIRTNANTKYPWASGSARKIVLKGVTVTGPLNYQHITANHVIYPDGRVMYRVQFDNPGNDVDTGAKVVAGQRIASLVLPCPAGVLNTVIGSPAGAGNGAVMSIEDLEVWK